VTPNGSKTREEQLILHNSGPNNNNNYILEPNDEKDNQKMEVVEETLSENTDPQVSKEAITAKEPPVQVEMEDGEEEEEEDEEQNQENGNPRRGDLSRMKSPEGNITILPKRFCLPIVAFYFIL
jgi:hypothetical protein